MIAESMKALVKGSSVIRAMFEEGNRLAKIYGVENVYDFSLGNPNVPAPAEVNEAIKEVVDEEDSVVLHGYMSNSGFEDVREAIAQSLNKRFDTHFNYTNIVMTVGAAGGLNTVLKTILNPGDEVLTFALSLVNIRIMWATLVESLLQYLLIQAHSSLSLTNLRSLSIRTQRQLLSIILTILQVLFTQRKLSKACKDYGR